MPQTGLQGVENACSGGCAALHVKVCSDSKRRTQTCFSLMVAQYDDNCPHDKASVGNALQLLVHVKLAGLACVTDMCNLGSHIMQGVSQHVSVVCTHYVSFLTTKPLAKRQ